MKKKLVILICYVLLEIAEHGQSVELECEKEGFAVVESTSCGVYYYCVKSANDVFNTVKFECPLGEGFSLLKLKCIPEEINECGKLPETPMDDPSLTDEFVCPSSGRFPDFKSPDCKSYYMCSNVLVPVLNNCPSTTIFSWISMKCVVPTTYTCPNSITTTTEVFTITTEETTGPMTTFSTDPSTTEVAAITTTKEPTSGANEPNSFVCTDIGRFPDPASTDCKTYYLCTTSVEGTYEAILNHCPSTTTFSPVDRKCLATGYQCSAGTSAKTDEPSTVESTTSYSTDVEEVTSAEPTTTMTTTDLKMPTTEIITTNDISTSATDRPTTDPAGETFACSESGRFPDPRSIDCKGYYLCSVNLKATLNKCPSVTIFHPESRKCVPPADYQCPTAVTTTQEHTDEPSTVETTVSSSETPTVTTAEPSTPVSTTEFPPPTEPFICTDVGRFPDPASTDCKGYYLCSTTGAGTFQAVRTQCPSVTIFSAEKNRCVLMSQYQCPTPITTPTVEPITTPETTISTSSATPSTTTNPVNFICTITGRHPDKTQPDCSKYKYCLLTATNVFLEYTFNCPTGSYFSPLELRCSMDYSCPALSPTVISEEATEFPIMATSFICTSAGRFPDPTSEGCDTYIMCLRTAVDSFQQYHFNCPIGSLFSPADAKCSTSYLCK